MWMIFVWNTVALIVFGYGTFVKGGSMWIWVLYAALSFFTYAQFRTTTERWTNNKNIS